MRAHLYKLFILQVCLGLTMTLPVAVDAYELGLGYHRSGESEYEINPNFRDTCAGSQADQLAAIRTAAEEWNYAGEACFEFVYGGQTSISYVSIFDNHNVIFSADEQGGGALAATLIVNNEVNLGWDIIFYDAGVSFCTGSRFDIEGIAVHELGHALGLDHTSVDCFVSCGYRSTMCSGVCSTGIGERTIEDDDIAGIQALYGFCPNCFDNDSDGYDDVSCGGADCNDSNPNVHPCATEICGNGTDDDCLDGDRSCGGGVMEQNPNETVGEAQDLGTVVSPKVAKGSLCTADFGSDYEGDRDYYRFTTPSPGSQPTIDIGLDWPGGGDFDLRLFDGTGTTFIKGSYVFQPEAISQVLDEGTDYIILVAGKTGPGDYTLTVSSGVTCDDLDLDGYSDEACGGDDCDDTDPAINPGAVEDCFDTVDNDCDGLVDGDDGDCAVEFTLLLDAYYDAGALHLDYTVGTPEEATWANYLILTSPTIQIIPLWTVPLPVINPPVFFPVSFPVPSMGQVGIFSGLFTAAGPEIIETPYVDTGF